jgi:hypothetical protein
MLVKIAGRVRGLFAGNYPENREEEQPHINSRGDQIAVQGLPFLTEIVRLGDSWQILSAAFTGLAALPTTVAGCSLWNGEPASGKCYVIDSVAVFRPIIDVTTIDMMGVFVMNNKSPIAAPTDAGINPSGLTGKRYGGLMKFVAGATVTNDGWFPAGSSAPVAPAIAGNGWNVHDVPLNGMYIVPPGGQFNLQCVEITNTASAFRAVIRWHEVLLLLKS